MELNDQQKINVLKSQRAVLLAQMEVQAAQKKLDSESSEFMKVVNAVATEMNLGSANYNLNLDTLELTPQNNG